MLSWLHRSPTVLFQHYFDVSLLLLHINSTVTMWRSSKQNTIPFISFLFFLTCVNGAHPGCNFPESSSSQSFFFDVRADTPTGSIITDSVVEPSDAQMRVTDVRSNNLKVGALVSPPFFQHSNLREAFFLGSKLKSAKMGNFD